jgi:hypothetical protein
MNEEVFDCVFNWWTGGELYPKHYQALVIACGELMIDTVLEEHEKPEEGK